MVKSGGSIASFPTSSNQRRVVVCGAYFIRGNVQPDLVGVNGLTGGGDRDPPWGKTVAMLCLYSVPLSNSCVSYSP